MGFSAIFALEVGLHIPALMTTHCRVCDSSNLEPAIDLGLQPWCNHFLAPEEAGREPFYPLRVIHCADCKTAQLDFTVKKEILFGDHTYLSGITETLSDHFARVAREVDDTYIGNRPGKCVLDIGSNDGTQLKHYQNLGYSVLGVESSRSTASIANSGGVETIRTFFNAEVARSLNRKFDVINASGVFFHLEELHSVTDGIRECLKDDGVFVVQFLYMKQIVENLAFDQIYHEHLLYYNLANDPDAAEAPRARDVRLLSVADSRRLHHWLCHSYRTAGRQPSIRNDACCRDSRPHPTNSKPIALRAGHRPEEGSEPGVPPAASAIKANRSSDLARRPKETRFSTISESAPISSSAWSRRIPCAGA